MSKYPALLLCESTKINKNKHVYRQGQVRKPTSSNVNEVWMLAYHKDGLWSSSFCLIFDSSVGLWVGIPSNGDSVYQTSKVIIQHSAEEKSLSPFDSKIACLCLSIKMNNIKHI